MNEQIIAFIQFLKTHKKMTNWQICELFKISSRMTLHRWINKEFVVSIHRFEQICIVMEDYMDKPAKQIYLEGCLDRANKVFGNSEATTFK